MTSSSFNPDGPKITVVFLLYNAAKLVPVLMAAVARQKHPDHPNQSEWLEILFMDDASRDNTIEVLRQELDRIASPTHYHVVLNPINLGLSRTLNKAFGL